MTRYLRRTQKTLWRGAPLLLYLCAALPAVAAEPVAQSQPAETGVYWSDFDHAVGADLTNWSRTTLTRTNNRGMLGPFENDAITLKLKDLPQHQYIRLRVRIVIMDAWMGSLKGSPDRLSIRLDDGRSLMHATFAGNVTTDDVGAQVRQSFPDDFPDARNAMKCGTEAMDVPWAPRSAEAWGGNAVYVLDLVLPHAAPQMDILFEGKLSKDQNARTKSWGLSNVEVTALEHGVGLAKAAVWKNIETLSSDDPMAAAQALRGLVANEDPKIEGIKAWMDERDAVALTGAHDLIAQLGDASFETRDAAEKQLIEQRGTAAEACRLALKSATDPEVQSRLARIVATLGTAAPDLQSLRLSRALQMIGGDAARELMRRLPTRKMVPDIRMVQEQLHPAPDEWRILENRIRAVLDLESQADEVGAASAWYGIDDAAPEMRRLTELSASNSTAEQLKRAVIAVRALPHPEASGMDRSILNALRSQRSKLQNVVTLRQEAVLIALHVLE